MRVAKKLGKSEKGKLSKKKKKKMKAELENELNLALSQTDDYVPRKDAKEQKTSKKNAQQAELEKELDLLFASENSGSDNLVAFNLGAKIKKSEPPRKDNMRKRILDSSSAKPETLRINFKNALEDQRQACFDLLDAITSASWSEQSEKKALDNYYAARSHVQRIVDQMEKQESMSK